MTANQSKRFVLDTMKDQHARQKGVWMPCGNGHQMRVETGFWARLGRTRPALGGPPLGFINGPGGLAGELPVEDNDPGPQPRQWLSSALDWIGDSLGWVGNSFIRQRGGTDP